MSGELAGHTLQATALVHEAYLRLVGPQDGVATPPQWQGRAHFFGAAAEAMRRILIDNARRKQRRKRGGHRLPDMRGSDVLSVTMGPFDVLELDEVLSRFAVQYPKRAELVKLRYFVGFGLAEAADVLGISRATAHRHWAFAKAWLYRALCEHDKPQVSSHATSFRAP
jgi:RNA polymerase sigma factor (TIGR02999 family)